MGQRGKKRRRGRVVGSPVPRLGFLLVERADFAVRIGRRECGYGPVRSRVDFGELGGLGLVERRYGRDVGLLLGHAFGACLGVCEHGVPFFCELGGIGIDVVRHIVLCDDV